MSESRQATARCAGCGGTVARAGDTCSFTCYEYCCSLFADGWSEYVRFMKSMEEQPWFDETQAYYERWVDAHDWEALRSALHTSE